jgi:DNA-binding transcriptional LysR family regulator
MIVSKLCDYKLQLYAHPNYLHQVTEGEIKLEDLGQHKWVSYVDNLLFTDELSYLKELASHLNEPLIPRFNSTSIISQYSAIKSGLGIGVLPCFVGDLDNELIKLHPQEIDIVRSFWLVTHPESKRLSHVATVWDYLKKLVKQQESLLMPK